MAQVEGRARSESSPQAHPKSCLGCGPGPGGGRAGASEPQAVTPRDCESSVQATSGSYESPRIVWRPASGEHERLEIDAQLNGGVVYADVLTSGDGLATVAQAHTFKVNDGANTLSLAGLDRHFGHVRVRLRFDASTAGASPLVTRIEAVSAP